MRSLTAIALASLVASCAAPTPHADGAPRFELIVLGTAQDGGMPHLGCDGPCCTEARRSGRVLYPSSLGIHDRDSGALLLIEATPAVEAQVALLQRATGTTGRGRRPVDGILLTHAHIGHYLGLAELGREVAATRSMPVWLTPRFADYLRGNGPWSQLVELGQIDLHEVQRSSTFSPLPGLRVEAIAVPHRDEFSDTVAFRIHGPRRTVLFVPDVDRWQDTAGLLERLLEGVDVAYLDGTFYDGRELPGRDLSEIPHPPMVDTMKHLQKRAAARPGSVRFIHLNHTNPVLHDPALRRALERRGFGVAQRGERVTL